MANADSVRPLRTKLGALDPQASTAAGGAVVLVGGVWFAVTALQGDPLVPVGLKNRDPKAFQVALTKIHGRSTTRSGVTTRFTLPIRPGPGRSTPCESGVLDPQRLDMESAIGEPQPFESDESYRTRLLVATQTAQHLVQLTMCFRQAVIAQPNRRGLGRCGGANRFRSVAFPVWRSLRRVGHRAAGLVAGAVPSRPRPSA